MNNTNLKDFMSNYKNKKQVIIKFASAKNLNEDLTSLKDFSSVFNKYAELLTDPYTSGNVNNKLLPLNDYQHYIKYRSVIITKISFYSIYVASIGNHEYTGDDVEKFISDSLVSPNYAYNMAGQRFTSFAGHQPNFFNPKVIINNNENIYNSLELSFPKLSNNNTSANLAMQSVGLELPHENYPFYEVENLDTIDVYAQHLQALHLPLGIRYQRYPVICELSLIVL